MNTIDFKKLNRMPYITKRLFIINNTCESADVDIEYLFGLFNIYNERNRGKFFWQRAQFGGALKDSFDSFNVEIDKIVKDLKLADRGRTEGQIKSAAELLDKLLVNIEVNCNVDRNRDFDNVKKQLGKIFQDLINENLYRKFE
ncbi:MAG: hypothetical protein PHN81_04955 [Actinomycetota bacterium]|nr:hypothetical protein [Actinomycetota bacterium]